MNDKKQIKEMAKEIANIHRCFLEDEGFEILDNYIAEKLIKQGYRKIPEGARVILNADDKEFVVLTREEYESLKTAKDFDYGYHEGERNMTSYYENIRLPEIRKETAREILKEVAKTSGDYQWFKNLCKQYGVEE